MSCEHPKSPGEGSDQTTLQKLKTHAKEFMEATPEEHKK